MSSLSRQIIPVSAQSEDKTEQKSYQPVTIKDDGLVYRESGKSDVRYGHKLFTFATGGQSYSISLNLTQQKQPDGTWKTIDSQVGMPRPTEANWYHGGFFNIFRAEAFPACEGTMPLGPEPVPLSSYPLDKSTGNNCDMNYRSK